MNSKTRVHNFFNRERIDRIPIDYFANGVINKKLMEHFRVSTQIGLLKALNVDFIRGNPEYVGPRLHPEKPGCSVRADLGIEERWVDNEFGGYMEYCEFPLAEADVEQIANYPLPDPDDYNYDTALERATSLSGEFAVSIGSPGYGCFINSNGFLRGMEQTFVDIITEDTAGLLLAKRRFELELKIMQRMLDKGKGVHDYMWLGEDLGTQISPLISLESYRKIIKPWHIKFVDLAKCYNIPVMIHTCGTSSWVYDDFIEIGVTAVDTLQPEAVAMSPAYLKSKFGGRLCFHGCISTAGPVASGTVDDVKKNIRETLEVMKPNYEYALAPTNLLQDNSPLENVLTMYECAKKYGMY